MQTPELLSGQTALVTGASSGLGPHIVRCLDAAGARVAIHYHQQAAAAEQLAGQLQHQAICIQADLNHDAQVDALFNQASEALQGLTILVNCAAVASQSLADLADLSSAVWAATMQANVTAPMRLTQLLAMQAIPAAVINISSIEATRPAPGHAHYATSKAALEMLTKAAALEYGPQGVRVNAIAPGLIQRPGIEDAWPEGVQRWQAAAPLGRLVDPEEIAHAAVYLASTQASCVTGQVLTIDCGLAASPAW
ncbi:MAG: SDR family oxidoreductase [Pseudomonadota bacterium]